MTGRFAPTPSGRMHIGNVYAMLGAWLSARKTGDSIRLRIEDIDEPRVVPNAAETMMHDLDWLGLNWDGEPVFQSTRHTLYQEALNLLSNLNIDEISDTISTIGISSNDSDSYGTTASNTTNTPGTTPLIYPCFCSRADIRAASAPQEGDRFTVYPGTCHRLIANDPQRVKQRLANGDRHSLRIATTDTTIAFHDEVFGNQRYNLVQDIGDTIVRRSDGIYSYQLAVTVDDLDMGITDIVRGRDLLRSSALQIYIRKALISAGFQPSEPAEATISYAHLPLIDNAAGQRLAKRERSLDLGILTAHGVTAQQIIGYCAWLLGLQGDHEHAEPQPMSAAEALGEFSWDAVRANTSDRVLDQAEFNAYFGLKPRSAVLFPLIPQSYPAVTQTAAYLLHGSTTSQ